MTVSEGAIPVETELQRKADAELMARLAIGSAGYPVFLALLWTTTQFHHEHPMLFCASSVVIALAVVTGLVLIPIQRRLQGSRRIYVLLPLAASVSLTAATLGVVYGFVVENYGFANWTFTAVMLWIVATAFGSVISLGSNFPLLVGQITLLLVPAATAGIALATREGVTFSFATFMLIIISLLQGHRLNGMYWRQLRDRANERRLMAELQSARDAAEMVCDAMRFRATHDLLTGINNRKEVLACLRRELDRCARTGGSLSILMLDLDHFKQVNDTFGHSVGDEVLKVVGQRVRNAVRSYDSVGRYGGEEFLIILPACGKDQIRNTSERIRAAVAHTPVILGDLEIPITASVGVAVVDSTSAGDKELLALAGEALHQAKNAGRDRVTVSVAPEAAPF